MGVAIGATTTKRYPLPLSLANELNLTEGKVESCIFWMLRFLKLTNRLELVRHACGAAQQVSGTYHLELATRSSKAILGPHRQPFRRKCV
jgi:hypothetical protein